MPSISDVHIASQGTSHLDELSWAGGLEAALEQISGKDFRPSAFPGAH